MKRFRLSNKEVKSLSAALPEALGKHLKSARAVEIYEIVDGRIYIYVADGMPIAARIAYQNSEYVVPTLYFIHRGPSSDVTEQYPKVVVDMGAVKPILNGADVMRPGIRRIEGDLRRDGVALVLDEAKLRPISISVSLYDKAEMESMDRGKALINLHYINDKIWNSCKELTERGIKP